VVQYPEAPRAPPPSLLPERKSRQFSKALKASVNWEATKAAGAPQVVSISFSESKYFSKIRQVIWWTHACAAPWLALFMPPNGAGALLLSRMP
jgi:hypothetical protein